MPDICFVNVAVLSAPFPIYTYVLPESPGADSWRPGLRVLTPVGRSVRTGVLLGPVEAAPDGVTVRPLLWPLETEPLMSQAYLEMVRALAARRTDSFVMTLASIVPAGLKRADVVFEVRIPGFPARLKASALRGMDDEQRRHLAQAWSEGRMRPLGLSGGEERRWVAVSGPPWPVRPGAVRQIAMLEHLWTSGPCGLPALRRALGEEAAQTLRQMETRGLVRVESGATEDDDHDDPKSDVASGPDLTPTDEQATVLADLGGLLASGLADGRSRTSLLHGVTGSGKTLVYLELAVACLKAGRNAVLLAPEAAIATHLRARAMRHAGLCAIDAEIILYHGYLPPSRKEAVFRRLAEPSGDRTGAPALIIGTRSALLLPMSDPGLIILDEEHDSSFKQDDRMVYQAKDIAWYRMAKAGGLFLLGSATPDVKTYHACVEGHIGLCAMTSRPGTSILPGIELLDLRGREPNRNTAPFAPESVSRLIETVERGEQVIIMLNRRGYSPLVYCVSCGKTARCPNCDVGLTFHKRRNLVTCHYCGWTRSFPLVCESCGSCEHLPMGEGVERIEESLRKILPPETGILRLDRDVSRTAESTDAILAEFAAGQAQILVGTQMIAKGHDFPGVTLVLVPNGDLGLGFPDYRAAEKTFQLLVQVAGRAGRGDKPGTVLIQTRNPEHYCWEYVIRNDYAGFYAKELEKRSRFGFPPFSKLALIRMDFPDGWEDGQTLLNALSNAARAAGVTHDVSVLGPAPAPLKRLKSRLRHNLLLKSKDWASLRAVFEKARQAVPDASKLRITLDLDPLDML